MDSSHCSLPRAGCGCGLSGERERPHPARMRPILLAAAIVWGCGSQVLTPSVPGSSQASDGGAVMASRDSGTPAVPGDAGPAGSDGGTPAADAGWSQDAGQPAQPDAGPVEPALNIELQPAARCAGWIPATAPPAVRPPPGTWTGLYTDGLSDLAAVEVHNEVYGDIPHIHFFPEDGGLPQVAYGVDRNVAAMPDGFIYTATQYGPCLVCGTNLFSWPGRGGLFIGDGYPWHGSCSYAVRPQGGVYAVCESSYPFTGGGVLSLQQLDEALSVTSETTGVAPKIVAVDRLDRLVESGDAGVRWIDAHGTPLSSFFGATAEGAFPLIGGGLLTTDDRMIPSGDSQTQPAADWLRGRAGSAFVVLSGRAYAFTDASCAARIYSAGGEFCGTLSFPGCSAPPRFGADDSAIVSLFGGGWGLWIRLLQ